MGHITACPANNIDKMQFRNVTKSTRQLLDGVFSNIRECIQEIMLALIPINPCRQFHLNLQGLIVKTWDGDDIINKWRFIVVFRCGKWCIDFLCVNVCIYLWCSFIDHRWLYQLHERRYTTLVKPFSCACSADNFINWNSMVIMEISFCCQRNRNNACIAPKFYTKHICDVAAKKMKWFEGRYSLRTNDFGIEFGLPVNVVKHVLPTCYFVPIVTGQLHGCFSSSCISCRYEHILYTCKHKLLCCLSASDLQQPWWYCDRKLNFMCASTNTYLTFLYACWADNMK